jgi:hypothetical protein
MSNPPIRLASVLSFVARYGAAIGITLAGVAVVTGEGCRWREKNQDLQKPAEAPPTEPSTLWVEVPVPCEDGQTVVYRRPSKKELERLAREYGFTLASPAPPGGPIPPDAPVSPSDGQIGSQPPGGAAGGPESGRPEVPDRTRRVLGEYELGILPAGGSALNWLDEEGRAHLSISANPVPFFEWGADWEVGVLAGVGDGMTMGRAWAAVEPLRVGRFHLRFEGGGNYRGGTTDPYLMAGGVFRMGEKR